MGTLPDCLGGIVVFLEAWTGRFLMWPGLAQQQQYPVSQQAQYQTQYQTPQASQSRSQASHPSQPSQPSRQVYTQYRPQPQRFGQAQAALQAPRSQLQLSNRPYNSNSSQSSRGYNPPRALLADARWADNFRPIATLNTSLLRCSASFPLYEKSP
ncbi:hypothetical protein N7513_004016 [Penicillium frequentans]|nr:hypothetical protein N7513_004016 [Penicillium glabrum]